MVEQKFNLSLKQTQKMIMTNNLQQSIKILQMSSNELQQLVEGELENNPLLQKPENEEEESEHESHVYEKNHKQKTNFQELENSELKEEKTLKQHIMEQIYVSISSPNQRAIALNLVDLIDEAGYLIATPKDLNEIKKNINCSIKDINQTLEIVKNFDPPGIFAQSLSECIELQLKDQNLLCEKTSIILENLQLLANCEFEKLAKKCQMNLSELFNKIKIIKGLNPKPGSNFISEKTQLMKPEIFITREKDQLNVSLNQDLLPKILINRKYYSKIKTDLNSDEKKYLSGKLHDANWLLKSLNQRAETMLKVATEIAFRQKEFFQKGIKFLKPMTLVEIAEAVELHESTISRITTKKYMQTPLGTFEMKYFFNSKIDNSESNDFHSSKTVQHLIKEIIDQETIENIYSDDEIVRILKKQNISIARRTIAKYRDILKIPTSVKRKKQKKMIKL